MSDSGPLDWAVTAESEARLTVDVLRVAHIRTIIALVDGNIYPCSLGIRLCIHLKENNFVLIKTENTGRFNLALNLVK